MFDSGITAEKLINELKSEVDIALEIPNDTYVTWLNSLEQFLYSEIIKEQREYIKDIPEIEFLPEKVYGEADVSFEDIYAVYSNDTQLIKSTLTSGEIFPNVFYKKDNQIKVNIAGYPKKIRVVYIVKPELKTPDNYLDMKVMLPIEFIELAKSKLRGEAYKLANEDELAAKWLNDYNILLETFKAWLTVKQPEFGM